VRTQKISLAVLLLAGLAATTVYAATDRSVILVLDASGSMKAKLPDGTSRMDAAKTAVKQLVSTLPGDTRLAFRAYGHQSNADQKNCQDTALLIPFDTVARNKAEVIAKATSLQPLGHTPITYALTQAGQDLLREEAAAHTVVLVSDGKETCESDPCAAAKSLAETDAKLVVHTVGAGVDEPTRNQLQCIAAAARGSYFDANGAAELTTVVAQAAVTTATDAAPVAVAKTPISPKSASTNKAAPTPLDAGEIVKGRLGESDKTGQFHYWKVAAPAGDYRVVLDVKRADDKHSNIQTELAAFGPDGNELAKVIGMNEIEFRTRDAATLNTAENRDITLRVSNGSGIVDYWLGIFPPDSAITAPYFARTPPVQPLEFGKAYAATLVPKPGAPAEAWYSMSLKAMDYKVSAEFKRMDSKKSNVQASVDIFGPIGEQLQEMNKNVCGVNEIDVGATCVTKLVLAQDTKVLVRITPNNDAAYSTVLKFEPINE
jgi:hypothetical protein